jgi:hypothetical protein
MFKRLCLSLLIIGGLTLVNSADAQTADLTGVWHTEGGPTFYVRQIGNEVWWFGEQSLVNPLWSNVASGTVSSGVIHVRWIDVPKGRTRNTGALTLRIVTPTHLTIIENPNDFWNRDWIR